MKKFAVIDIGSNSVRLMQVADGKVLYKRLTTTRLGEGIAFSSNLKEEAISRTAMAVQAFYLQAKEEGAQEIYAFATAAVRTAQNGQAFVDKVATLCPLQVQVVDGETEAQLGILGALGKEDGALVDVGGASTELIVQRKGEIIYKKSVNVGIVRLKDECGRDREKLNKVIATRLQDFGNVPPLTDVYAIGGTATTLGALYANLEEYDGRKVTGTQIPFEDMKNMAEWLLTMSVEETATLACVSKGREDVLAGGVLWLASIMENFHVAKLTVSDNDNLEGFAKWKGLL